MIWLITCYDPEIKKEVVSHGIDHDTNKVVILPCEPLQYFSKDMRYCSEAGMYYLED